MSNNELYVKHDDNHRRVLYLVKELLKAQPTINVVTNYKSAFTVSRVCNTLVTLGYANFSNINTKTDIVEGRRRIKIIVTVAKSENFQKIYDENEAKRQEYLDKKEAQKSEKTETKN